jgi:hypothetical protein
MCLGIPGPIIRIDDAVRVLTTVDVSGALRQINVAGIELGEAQAEIEAMSRSAFVKGDRQCPVRRQSSMRRWRRFAGISSVRALP